MNFPGVHYLDTNAVIRLLLYPDVLESLPQTSVLLDAYVKENQCFNVFDVCLVEALSVVKRRYKKSKAQILNRLRGRISHTWRIENVDMVRLFPEALSYAEKFNIDVVDALQVAALKQKSIYCLLVTGDNALYKAAVANNVRSWNFIKEERPPLPLACD
ncbi:MAG: hypothetical protein V3573_00285 [Desulfovibrionaceae bacterium]